MLPFEDLLNFMLGEATFVPLSSPTDKLNEVNMFINNKAGQA